MTPRPPSKKTSRWGFVLCIFSFASAIALMVHLTGQRTTVTALDFEPADTGTTISAKSTVQPESSFKNKDAFVSATATVPDHSTVPSSKTNFEPLSAEPKIDAVTGSIFDDFKAWSRQYLEHSCKNNTHDQLCDRLDPRVLNGMLRAGEKLAKARKVEMTALMRKDPKKQYLSRYSPVLLRTCRHRFPCILKNGRMHWLICKAFTPAPFRTIPLVTSKRSRNSQMEEN